MKPANECKCNVVVNRCADAGQQAVIEQLRAQLTAEQAKSEKLAGQVAMLHETLSGIEWDSCEFDQGGDSQYICPSCGGNKYESDYADAGHKENCALDKSLTATQSDVEAYLADIKNQGAIEALEEAARKLGGAHFDRSAMGIQQRLEDMAVGLKDRSF